MLVEIVVPVAGLAAVGLWSWGLRLVREIHELEGLSARSIGPPAGAIALWPATEDQAG